MSGTVRAKTALGLAVLVLVIVVVAQGAFAALTWTERRLTSTPQMEYQVSSWGNLVVYTVWDGTAVDSDIHMYDVARDREIPIVQDSAHPQAEPRIYGDIIVWTDQRNGKTDVYMHDLSTGEETRLTDEDVEQSTPAVHGTNVVWHDERSTTSGYDIWRFDLVNGAEQRALLAPGDQGYADIFGERIVFEDYNTPSGEADVHMLDLVDGSVTRITDEYASAVHDEIQDYPRIWGDRVVWSDRRNHGGTAYDIYAYDIAEGQERRLTDQNADQVRPAIFRDVVTWADRRNHGGIDDVYAYDERDDTEWRLTDDDEIQYRPDVWGSRITFEDFRDGAQYDIWMADLDVEADRSAGDTRYGTAATVSMNHFANAGTVVLATGAEFADALSASALAGCYGCPVLLTLPDQLSPEAHTEISRLGANRVVVVGGEGAITPAVADALAGMGLAVLRIGGADRYHTSQLVAAEVGRMTGDRFERTVLLARGDEFPDALAGSPVAYYNRFPILLTRPDEMPSATESAIEGLDAERGVVLGGPGAVSPDVKARFDALLGANGGTDPSARWSGPTRYETAAEIARHASAAYWAGTGHIGLAVGDNFPDALTGGAATGREFGVLLLTRSDDLPMAAEEFIADVSAGVAWVEAFGGSAVVSDAVANEVLQLLP